jgi:hypothetical protein
MIPTPPQNISFDILRRGNFFIDSLYTKNIRGIYYIIYNHYDRYRNSTKLHIITDSNNIPIIYEFSEENVHDVNIAKIFIVLLLSLRIFFTMSIINNK